MRIDLLKEQKIKWEGTTDFGEFYKYLKLWLEDNNYVKGDGESLEKKYIERAKGDKKQLEIIWNSQKKKSEFFVYHLDVTFLILGMSDVEVQQESIKRKMQKGVFE